MRKRHHRTIVLTTNLRMSILIFNYHIIYIYAYAYLWFLVQIFIYFYFWLVQYCLWLCEMLWLTVRSFMAAEWCLSNFKWVSLLFSLVKHKLLFPKYNRFQSNEMIITIILLLFCCKLLFFIVEMHCTYVFFVLFIFNLSVRIYTSFYRWNILYSRFRPKKLCSKHFATFITFIASL